MGLLDIVKSVLGLGTSESRDEPAVQGDASNEATVKGTDAAASTGSLTEEPPTPGEEVPVEAAAEPAEAAGEVSEAAGTDHEAAEPAEPAEAAGPVPDEPEGGERSVESISGIGPAYAKRLADAGIDSIAALAEADAATLAEETDISEKRIGRWIDRAKDA